MHAIHQPRTCDAKQHASATRRTRPGPGLPTRAAGWLAMVLLAFMLLACGGGGGGNTTAPAPANGGGGAGGGAGGGGAGGGGATAQTASERFCAMSFPRSFRVDDVDDVFTLTAGTIVPIGAPPQRASPCVVDGSVGDIRFRIVLPESWNGELHMYGGGGFNGSIPELPVDAVLPPASSAVLVGTDGGHRGTPFDGSWALGNERAIDDFAALAVHKVIAIARQMTVLRYDNDGGEYTYFIGCSNGGREGLVAAQRFPDDFDGVIARAPALNYTGLFVLAQKIQRAVNQPGGRLTSRQLEALQAATLNHCDGQDGVRDGRISNYHCTFDPTVLRCANDAAPDGTCLTAANLATLAAIHEETTLPHVQANGLTSIPGYGWGNEALQLAYPAWITGDPEVPVFATPLGLQGANAFLRHFVLDDPQADVLAADLAAPGTATRLEQRSRQLDAANPDLSAFAARGGKLILWHGASDYAVPLRSTARYHDAVRAAHPAPGSNERPAAASFMRFYVAPDVLHCGEGPGGAEEPGKLLATLRDWVQAGTTPPDRLDHDVVIDSDTGARGQATWCQYPAFLQEQDSTRPQCVLPPTD